MPDSIKIQNKSEIPITTANLIPCHIQYNGSANTKDFFTTSRTTETTDEGKVNEIAYFRGLRLVGEKFDLNKKGYTGYLINKSESIERVQSNNTDVYDEEVSYVQQDEELVTVNTYNPTAMFNDFIVYGHDMIAELDCQWKLIDEWDQISDIIHG